MGKILKAELWDKIQYLFRSYYDRISRCVLYYDGEIDVAILSNVLVWITEHQQILRSSFHANAVEPFWVAEKYQRSDIIGANLNCADNAELEREIDKFICGGIEADNNVQYKVAVFSDGTKWAIAAIANQMCMDSDDFKYFIGQLVANYNLALNGGRGFELFIRGRGYDEASNKLSADELKIAKTLYKNFNNRPDDHVFPLTAKSETDQAAIIRRKVGAEIFSEIVRLGKAASITVNDLMIAFYIRALYQIGMAKDDERLTAPCLAAIRRNIIDEGVGAGLFRNTGFEMCSAEGKGETVCDTLSSILRSAESAKVENSTGANGLPLIKFAYAIFPFIFGEKVAKLGAIKPLGGMCNLGALNADALKLGGHDIADGFMSAAVNRKPFVQLGLTSLRDELTLSVALRCNAEDKQIVNRFLDFVEENMREYIALNNQKNKTTKPPKTKQQNQLPNEPTQQNRLPNEPTQQNRLPNEQTNATNIVCQTAPNERTNSVCRAVTTLDGSDI